MQIQWPNNYTGDMVQHGSTYYIQLWMNIAYLLTRKAVDSWRNGTLVGKVSGDSPLVLWASSPDKTWVKYQPIFRSIAPCLQCPKMKHRWLIIALIAYMYAFMIHLWPCNPCDLCDPTILSCIHGTLPSLQWPHYFSGALSPQSDLQNILIQ